ncbi:globin [Deinococcus alpinitundrae]|uniref:globin domain-containing protein n=1 Tax=Deinococcus alpinitundrae TaxID=468913 RepID=UPI00137B85D3|nr:globin [Deinococcus alpinitundrae]
MTAPLQLATSPEDTLYSRIGPATLHDLVTRFYGHVAQHPDLIPIFPTDLSLTARKQEAFLSGFLGGPPLYHQQFGHPRLRARHLPFEITPTRGRAWLSCMNAAMRETPGLKPEDAAELFAALRRTAAAMVNTPDPEQ